MGCGFSCKARSSSLSFTYLLQLIKLSCLACLSNRVLCRLVELFQWKQLHVCFKFPYFLCNHDFIVWIHSWMLEPRFHFCQSVLWIFRSFLTACFVVSAFCSFMNNSGEKNKARIIAIWKREKKNRFTGKGIFWAAVSVSCSSDGAC